MKKLLFLLAVVILIAAPFGLKPYGIYLLSLWVVMTIAAIGLNLTLGYAGQISLAQGSFVGIGAYAAALLTTQGWPLWSAFLLATALSLLLMVMVGGSGYFLGPFLGAAVSVLLPEWTRFTGGLYLIIYAIAVMLLMAICPSGLLGLAERFRKRTA